MKEILEATKGKEIYIKTAGGHYVNTSKNALLKLLKTMEASPYCTHIATVANYQPSGDTIFIDFRPKLPKLDL